MRGVPEDDGRGDRSHDGCKDGDAPEGLGVALCQAGLGVAQGELAAQEPHQPGAARPFGDSAFRKPVRMSLKKSGLFHVGPVAALGHCVNRSFGKGVARFMGHRNRYDRVVLAPYQHHRDRGLPEPGQEVAAGPEPEDVDPGPERTQHGGTRSGQLPCPDEFRQDFVETVGQMVEDSLPYAEPSVEPWVKEQLADAGDGHQPQHPRDPSS